MPLKSADVLPDERDVGHFDRSEAARSSGFLLGILTGARRELCGGATAWRPTLDEVGQHHGLTEERITTIQEKTLTKLSHRKRSQPLITHHHD